MAKKTYIERMWLNDDESSSTGSVVACDAPARWAKKGKKGRDIFLEVSDCNSSVRLHQCPRDTSADFLAKMKRLHGVIGRFIEHLEKQEAKKNG